MTTIVTRAGKGTPLTYAEMDANFTNLNNDKLEVTTAAATYATLAQVALKVDRTSTTGSAVVPTGTTAQRDGTPQVGYLRYNITLSQFEGYSNGVWGAIGGGAVGGGTDKVFVQNHTDVSAPWEIGQDNMVSGVTVTIASPAVFTLNNHGFVAGMQVRLKTTGALPTGLAQTRYYVLATGLTTNTFQLSATLGGAAIATSGTQSGVHSVGRCMNANVAGPLSVLDSGSITIPDGCALVISG
jgi:hypothetical protein